MFLRIRGKGACPENSQAALLHLRGFRHVHCPPPMGSSTLATVLDLEHERVGEMGCTGTSSATATGVEKEVRPHCYAHFAMGIQAPSVIEDQRRMERQNQETNEEPRGRMLPAVVEPAGAQDAFNAFLPMVWKELWNAYDICYDEIPLLPDDFVSTEEQLRKLGAVLAESKRDTVSKTATVDAAAAPVVANGFALPSTLTGNKKTVVCTHYFSQAAWPANLFNTANNLPPVSLEHQPNGESAIVVIDLTDLPAQNCGSRLAISLAWALGFASIQEDNALLRASAFVVRLPYTCVPQTRPAPGLDANGALTILSALTEARDFLCQHIQLVLTACHVALRESTDTAATAAATEGAVPRPPILFVGNRTEDLHAAVRALSKPTAPSAVVVLRTDEHRPAAQAPLEDEAVISAERSEMDALAAAAAAAGGVQLIVAPVKALIDGGEEPWDAYTLKERSRLNFCPCCGSCGVTEGQEGSDEGAGHHHHHGHAGGGGSGGHSHSH